MIGRERQGKRQRLIKIDEKGYAKTQFKYFNTSVGFFNIDQSMANSLDGIEIFYENDLNNKLPMCWRCPECGVGETNYIAYTKNKVVAFELGEFDDRFEIIISKAGNYNSYFYSEKEKKEMQKKVSELGILPDNFMREVYRKKLDSLTYLK